MCACPSGKHPCYLYREIPADTSHPVEVKETRARVRLFLNVKKGNAEESREGGKSDFAGGAMEGRKSTPRGEQH